MTSVKVLQANLNRSRAAHDVAVAVSKRDDIDVLVACEPNHKVVRGNSGWVTDKREDVSVWFFRKNIKVEDVIRRLGFLWIKLEKGPAVLAAYISPNTTMDSYQEQLNEVMGLAEERGGEVIIMGDLNAKAVEWGSPQTDDRGRRVGEWIASLNLTVLNVGNKPTCIRPNGQSIVDITLCTQGTARKASNWRVTDEVTLSDHQHIEFDLSIESKIAKNVGKAREIAWVDYGALRRDFGSQIRWRQGRVPIEEITDIIRSVQDRHTRKGRDGQNKVPYWWNEDIESTRNRCITSRRVLLRLPTGTENGERMARQEEYKELKKRLHNAIRKAKRKSWRDLCEALEEDVWGQGYKLAVRHLKGFGKAFEITEAQKVDIARELFPERNDTWIPGEVTVPPPLISVEEVKKAAEGIKSGTAPGLDKLLPQSIKECVKECPEVITDALNELLLRFSLPGDWKRAKLVLIPKGENAVDTKKYRPICLLQVVAKLFERVIRDRLNMELEENGGLSPHQFGFRKTRSTVMAIERVVEAKRWCDEPWVILIALDVRNAFNTASWGRIITKLRERNIPQYLVKTIEAYLAERSILVERTILEITAGVPQGSVLGPTLWNVLYDDVLRMELPPGVKITAYADDLAITVPARNIADLNEKTNEALRRIDMWMTRHALSLAPEKTDAMIMKGPRARTAIDIRIRGERIPLTKEVRYLGVTLDTQGYFGKHVVNTVKKAEGRVAAIGRIMPNIGGPGGQKRRVLWGVVQSTILYAAPIWKSALRINRYKDMLEATQRKALLRVGFAYVTVSAMAMQVITGIPPIDLLVEERARTWGGGQNPQDKKAAADETLTRWQERWEANQDAGQWTKTLIPSIGMWTACRHRKLNYYITQFLSGHGSFRTFTYKIKKDRVNTCRYCGEVDSPEHTIFRCARWDEARVRLWAHRNGGLNPGNIIRNMVESKEAWTHICAGITEIMTHKENEERAFQAGNPPP